MGSAAGKQVDKKTMRVALRPEVCALKNSTSDVKTERQEGSFMNQNQNRGIDALHGGLAVYDGSTDKFVFQYCSDTLVKLICGDRSEFEALTRGNALQIVCECDRGRWNKPLRVAREEHTELSTHFWLKSRRRQIWCHLVGWMVGEEFSAVLRTISGGPAVSAHCQMIGGRLFM